MNLNRKKKSQNLRISKILAANSFFAKYTKARFNNSLDNFGTGYSSTGYILTQINLDTLKNRHKHICWIIIGVSERVIYITIAIIDMAFRFKF